MLGLPLVGLMALSLIYQRMGVFVLSALAGNAVTGYFSATSRLVEAAKMLPIAVLGALFPVLSREQRPMSQVDSELLGMLAFAAIAAALLHLAAPMVIPTLFGSDYTPAIPVLQMLGWSLLPYSLGAWLSLKLVAAHRERAVLIAMIFVVP